MLFNFSGYYNKRPSGNIKVQNLSMSVFGMAFSVVAILIQDFDAIANKLRQNSSSYLYTYSVTNFLKLHVN